MSFSPSDDACSLYYFFRSDNRSRFSVAALAIGILVLLIYAGIHFLRRRERDGFPYVPGLPLIGSLGFFTKRHGFVHEGIVKYGDIFSFNVLQHNILLVSGVDARKAFFSHRDLNPSEGYKVLFGPTPKFEDIKVENTVDGDDNLAEFGKRLSLLLRPDRLEKILPTMLKDLDRSMVKWGTRGRFNPFDDVYNMVFQLTCRAMSSREIADVSSVVSKLTQLFWEIELGGTPTAILLPWFPSPARKLKEKATTELYLLLKGILQKRVEEGRTEDDPAQVLLDGGDDVDEVVKFFMGGLFAGITNTGIMASWLSLFLAANLEWKEKVLSEARSLVLKYAPENGILSERLAHLSPKVWEEDMPVLDACLRETIRIAMTGTVLRRVLPSDEGEDVIFKGKKLTPGSFAAYAPSETHLNPKIYPNPEVWDPSRYERGEDRKEYWAYLGWGVGRHPCLGMRFAKLEVKLITTMLLMQYDYELVDSTGKPVYKLPDLDRHNTHKFPPVKPVYIQYNRVEN